MATIVSLSGGHRASAQPESERSGHHAASASYEKALSFGNG